ncbi:MAG: hypothetical protein ACKOKC_16475, partial [Chthoniobacterales bacterium]
AQESFSKQVAGEDQRQQEIHKAAVHTTKTWLAGLLLAPLTIIVMGTLAIAASLGFQKLGNKPEDSWTR